MKNLVSKKAGWEKFTVAVTDPSDGLIFSGCFINLADMSSR